MASLFDNLGSSDSEDDVDYVPEDEGSSDDEEPKPANCSTDEESETPKNEAKASNEKAEMDENEKEKANDIYASFLKEVESEMKSKEECDLGICRTSSAAISSSSAAISSSSAASSATSSAASSSINSPIVSSDVISEKETSEKPAEVVEFAGETIAVTKDGTILSADSSTDSKKDPAERAAPVKRKGLQSVLGAIQSKKTKVSTLQKSALDWNTYKKETGIAEDLERFNKGKGGFVERQRFLERSDVRSFEIERDMRLKRFKK